MKIVLGDEDEKAVILGKRRKTSNSSSSGESVELEKGAKSNVKHLLIGTF